MPYQQLTLNERYHIQALCQQRVSICEMARQLQRSKSTISRELKRFDGQVYSALAAQKATDKRRRLALKATKMSDRMIATIRGLIGDWTPQAIAARLAAEGAFFRVSHETIYRYIYADKAAGGCLYRALPRKGKRYKYERSCSDLQGKIGNRRSIHDRPPPLINAAKQGILKPTPSMASKAAY
jgi:IS30 family transposase